MRYFLVLIAAVLLSSAAYAQLSIRVNFNVDRQPAWGPTGYDRVEYYYLPDIEVYYYVPQQRFIYFERGRWRNSSSLPPRFRGHDLYNSYKVVVNEPKPYLNHAAYKEQYSSYRDRHDQRSIRDSRDSRYFVNRNHPEHKNWVKQQRGNSRNDTNTDRRNNRRGR